MTEKKHRIEDALEAVRSAQQEGIVPGGGLTLYRLAQTILEDIKGIELTEDQQFAAEIFYDVLRSPMSAMCDNAGVDFDEIDAVLKARSDNTGFNFLTGEPVDMYESGIIDPAKVTKNALQNAVSAAGTLLTTNFAIIEESDKG
jgi:chaperonin GroEL